MKLLSAVLSAALLAAVFGCTRADPSPSARAPGASASTTNAAATPAMPSFAASGPADAAAVSDGRHACAKDAECTLSCTHGAVNRDWYRKSHPGGEACEDGCAAKGTSVACTAGQCVAMRGGAVDSSCTGVVKPVEAIGPYHRCTSARDCTLTCKYGALNAARARSLVDDCDDGCAVHEVDCRAGSCVAVNHGAVVSGCSHVSIWK
ncbi:hypothetical protein BH09MYX1_BH09MYX1_15520 [soil metagenome]